MNDACLGTCCFSDVLSCWPLGSAAWAVLAEMQSATSRQVLVAHVLSPVNQRWMQSSFRILLQPAGLQGGEVLKTATTGIEEHQHEMVQAGNNHRTAIVSAKEVQMTKPIRCIKL